jgi:predicted transcriptional regulator
MEPITPNSWMTFFVIFITLLSVIFIAVALYYSGRRGVKKIDPQMTAYERLYIGIQQAIDNWQVNEKSYNVISKLFDQLSELPCKNSEMTEVLNNQFKEKYKSIKDEINSYEEFDPGQVLKN